MSRRCVLSDPIRFALDERSLQGRVALADMARLSDLLVDSTGEASWVLSGERDAGGKPFLRLEVQARPVLRCQRCLTGLEWDFDHVSVLRLVRPGTPIGDDDLENDEYDTIEAQPDLDVIALLEEEMLLALPLAPVHENCEPPRPLGGDEKKSPFDVLASLRGSNKLQ
ncbi:MAG: YceD family protein [Zoogloeaceae bacterium]|nr:YceD family protein [Zoogloeaceae bacterium]